MANRIDPSDTKVVTAGELKNRRDPDTGRFVATDPDPAPSMIPEIGAALAQALLDADAEAWRIKATTRTSERLVSAIEFGDRIANQVVRS